MFFKAHSLQVAFNRGSAMSKGMEIDQINPQVGKTVAAPVVDVPEVDDDPMVLVEKLDPSKLEAKGLLWSKVKGHPYWCVTCEHLLPEAYIVVGTVGIYVSRHGWIIPC
jgi:hypothetical protein